MREFLCNFRCLSTLLAMNAKEVTRASCSGLTLCVYARARAFVYYMQCEELAKEGASIGSSPADVVRKCPITIAMLADPEVALTVGFLLSP